MKRNLVYLMVAAALISGCTKQDALQESDSAKPQHLSFETFLGKPTKGSSKTGFVFGDQLYIYGVKTGAANFNLKTPKWTESVFNTPSKGIVLSSIGTTWTYETPVAWDAQKATFFGFSPVPNTGNNYGISGHDAILATDSIPKISFEVKGGYVAGADVATIAKSRELTKEQADLLWAYSPDNVKENDEIVMAYNHALCMVNFSVKAAHAGGLLRINEILLENLKSKATLKLAHTIPAPVPLTYLGGWSGHTTPKNYAVNLKNEVVSAIQPGADALKVTDDDEALLLIPQSLTGVVLRVKYSYSANGTEWESYQGGINLDYNMENIASHLQPNKKYNYVLHITPKASISFTTDVDPWAPTVNDIEFNKVDALKAGGNVMSMTLADGDIIEASDDTGWITYVLDNGVPAELTTAGFTVVPATAGNYKFAAKDNTAGTTRDVVVQITKKLDGKVVKYRITQL